MEADFLAKLEATPQKVLLQSRRQEAFIDPKDRPPVPAWKKIRGPPKSLKEDEEHEPIRSVLVRLLKNQNSGDGSGVAEQCIGKKGSATQEIEAHQTSKMNGWFDIEDVCKFFDELQVFYNPEDLAFLETLTVVKVSLKNAEEEAVVSEESYLFVDSLDDIEVIIDFHTAVCSVQAEDESPSTEVSNFQDDNGLTYSVVRGIVAYQALFRGHFARRILRSANFPLSAEKTEISDRPVSPDIQRTVRGLKYLLDCLNETTDSEKANLFRSIQRQFGCRCLPDDANFFTRRLQAGTFSDVSAKPVGCIWSAPANYVQPAIIKQCLYPLFYQTILISEELARFRIHLKSDEGVARVIVIDNDSGCAIESKKGYYFALEVNRLGYCLLAYVLSEDQVNSNSNWQFSCLCEGWKELNFPKMYSSFAFWEANGVLEAGDDGLLFRFSLDITLRQVVSLVLKIGNPTIPARLILRSSDGSELANAHEEPGGVYLMSALLLGPDLKSEEGGIAMKCDSLGVRQEDNKDAKATKALEASDNYEECKKVCKEGKCT
ncbi:unnamed protein product [Taenia asiatica]|uniref:SH2 domain-containing protein n=1 Tax=Taenia asiatica TaxID=60517 RepID=A0A0R3W8U5_TAEAS|nr:unnamed protein product [Taenia asiatica]